MTEGRATFMPWLLWCFDRQAWPTRELVIIDSSEQPVQVAARDDVRVLTVPTRTAVPAKRNIALQEAHGEILTWFDDDDWQHPYKLVWLIEALCGGAPYAGSTSGWFVDLRELRCAPYRGSAGRITFNGAGFRRDAVIPFTFREQIYRASDTHWMRTIAARYRGQEALVDRGDLFFWLSHEGNLSNPARKRRFRHDLSTLRDRVGPAAWGDTDVALDSLRRRVVGTFDEPAVEHAKGD